MSTTTIVILLIVGFELALVAVLLPMLARSTWGEMARGHPPMEPAPDAVRKPFQSFGCGLLNMGWSVHVATDADYLHLRPVLPFRLIGAKPTSIPWEAIDSVDLRRFASTARIGKTTLRAPMWCLELAAQNTTTTA